MLDQLQSLSIIMPVHPEEDQWHGVVEDLRIIPDGTELIVAGPTAPIKMMETLKIKYSKRFVIKFITTELGRAVQMNQGVKAANGEVLWFLHADTRINRNAIRRLNISLKRYPYALHYFDLVFNPDGPKLVILNKLGSYLRSHVLNLPFGDQALAIRKKTFLEIGGYCEQSAYPEDHLFVAASIRSGIQIVCTGGKVYTSARKYQKYGWLRTTCIHLTKTAEVALNQSWTHSEHVNRMKKMRIKNIKNWISEK